MLPADDPSSEKPARAHRNRVLKRGTIILGVNKSEIACTVRNQHDGGAELMVPADTILPSTFMLYVPTDSVAYDCELRWHRNERAGVRFLGRGPKPKLHYG